MSLRHYLTDRSSWLAQQSDRVMNVRHLFGGELFSAPFAFLSEASSVREKKRRLHTLNTDAAIKLAVA